MSKAVDSTIDTMYSHMVILSTLSQSLGEFHARLNQESKRKKTAKNNDTFGYFVLKDRLDSSTGYLCSLTFSHGFYVIRKFLISDFLNELMLKIRDLGFSP